jgi:hypothetical protein
MKYQSLGMTSLESPASQLHSTRVITYRPNYRPDILMYRRIGNLRCSFIGIVWNNATSIPHGIPARQLEGKTGVPRGRSASLGGPEQ